MLKIFNWTPCPNTSQQIFVDHTLTAEDAANAVIPKLLALPSGQRSIMHWWGMLKDSSYNTAFSWTFETILSDIKIGPDTVFPEAWTREFYQRLNIAGVVPDYIWLDEEGVRSFWNLPASCINNLGFFQSIWKLNISMTMRTFTPEDMVGGPNQHNAVLAFDRWLGVANAQAIRGTLVQTAYNAFNKTIPCSNFEDTRVSFQTYDTNNWERSDTEHRSGNWVSPALYLVNGWRGSILGQKKNPFWNRLIDCVNIASSALNLSGYVAPWISYPGFGAVSGVVTPEQMQWLWTQLVWLLHNAGVNTLLYWNPDTTMDVYASQVFGNMQAAHAVGRKERTEIPQDSDVISVGTMSVSYVEFLQVFPVMQDMSTLMSVAMPSSSVLRMRVKKL